MRPFRDYWTVALKLTLIPRDQNHLRGPPVSAGTYRGQAINGIFAQVYLTVGIVGLRTQSLVIFHLWNAYQKIHTQQQAESPH